MICLSIRGWHDSLDVEANSERKVVLVWSWSGPSLVLILAPSEYITYLGLSAA